MHKSGLKMYCVISNKTAEMFALDWCLWFIKKSLVKQSEKNEYKQYIEMKTIPDVDTQLKTTATIIYG